MKRIVTIMTLLLLCLRIYGQAEQRTEKVEIYFDRAEYAVDSVFRSNGAALNKLSELIAELQKDSLTVVTKIEINSFASPEGSRTLNQRLSQQRTDAIYDYLLRMTSASREQITRSHSGADWNGLRSNMLASDKHYKDEVVDIIDNVDEETWKRIDPSDRWLTLVDSRNKHLMEINEGETYREIFAGVYPELRRGSVVVVYLESAAPEPEPEPTQESVQEPFVKQAPAGESVIEYLHPDPLMTNVESESSEIEVATRPLVALKTNLLFDAATLINLELEIPINNKVSIAGELIFPWWTSCGDNYDAASKRNTLQLLNANIEAKYWLGERAMRPAMTGWYLGLYAGGGIYDLERNAKGYQGEFFIASGVSGGYAHTINKCGNLRMEYSLGVGYLKTNYRRYQEHFGIDDSWHTIRKNTGNYTWMGPTKAKVSLVWMLNRKANKHN